MAPRVSVVIPVYNEAPYLETVVRNVLASGIDSEVIVVDDGSTDGTGEILRRLAQETPIRVIAQARNAGKGAALHAGFQASRGEILLIQDADLEYDPEDYPALLKPLFERRASVVYGSRFLGPHRASYFWHRVGNWVIVLWVDLLFNASLTDVETGYKAFRREVLDGMSLRCPRFDFEVEFTCKLLRRGRLIFEVPVSYYGRTYAEGKKITWKDGVRALWVIGCCRINPWY